MSVNIADIKLFASLDGTQHYLFPSGVKISPSRITATQEERIMRARSESRQVLESNKDFRAPN